MPREPKYLAPIVREIHALAAKHPSWTEEEQRRYYDLHRQREREQRDAIPKLQCCEDAKRYHAIRFYVDIHTGKQPPTEGCWIVLEHEECRTGEDLLKRREPDPEPRFCPFCASPIPAMHLKKDPPKDLMVCLDHNHCDTCSEPLRSCMCLPPEAAFSPSSEERHSETRVTYPVFELVGPPCESPGCKGVLVSTTCLKTRDCFRRCATCGKEFHRQTAAEVLADFERTLGRLVPKNEEPQ